MLVWARWMDGVLDSRLVNDLKMELCLVHYSVGK